MRNTRRQTENKLELFAEVLDDPGNNFTISLEKLVLKNLANNKVFEHTKNTFEIEIVNEVSKQNTFDQVKGNAIKLRYTKNGKNINDSSSLIQNYYL